MWSPGTLFAYLYFKIDKFGFVAIAEQIGGLEVNSKNYQKIFKRDVVRIITPGTILEDNLLEPKSFNNLLSNLFKRRMTLTWIDRQQV